MGQPQRARALPDLYLLLNGRSRATPSPPARRTTSTTTVIYRQDIAALPSLAISPKERAKGQKQDKGAVAELVREAPPSLLQPRGFAR